MKNLGKIFLVLLLLPNAIYANVVASVDYSSVSVGETVTYSLKINGNDVDRPHIEKICDSNVISTSSQTNIEMINGEYKRSKILSYQFMPQKSCEIESMDIVVDGNPQKTNALKVEVKPASQDVNADFLLTLQSDKKELYVGEPFELTLLVKQKHSSAVVDSKFIAPKLQGFWVKNESQPQRYDDGEFTVTKVVYKISSQRAGTLKIEPAQIAIATRVNSRDMWGSFSPQVKWKSYFSNELSVTTKPIPNGATLIGDFSIKASVDKQEINPNEAVNVSVEVIGEGNLEDIQSFKPYINNVSVFDEKPVVNGIKLQQKIALVGDDSFTIPSFKLQYFNTKTAKIEEIRTKEIQIKVNGAKPAHELKIKRDEEVSVAVKTPPVVMVENRLTLLYGFIIFIVGLTLGIILMLLKPWNILQREKSFDVKNEKTLLVKLMPYSEDAQVKSMMDVLENNVYSNAKTQVDKKLLKEILNKYKIS